MSRMAGLTWQRGQGGQGSPGRAMLWTGPLLNGAAPPAWPRLALVFLTGKTGSPVIKCLSLGGGRCFGLCLQTDIHIKRFYHG